MSEASEYQKLRSHLAFLRMTAAAEALPAQLDHAGKAKLSHQGFLERLLGVEVSAVEERRRASLARFVSSAFPVHARRLRLFGPAVGGQKAHRRAGDVALCRRRHQRPADRAARCRQDDAGSWARPCCPGGRDAHLLHHRSRPRRPPPPRRLEGRWANTMRFYMGPSLLIIDEVGYLPLPGEAASALFQVVSRRYLKGSIALTTNLGIASWGKVFNDDPMIAAAMLDRLLHRSVVMNIDGDSYRMRSHRARAEAARRAVAGS